ncbi:MAG: hypothetical protein LC780_06520 [Acidobacteria bacterium]|nr:hypothetical protein [Acidobacteriota bacterium]
MTLSRAVRGLTLMAVFAVTPVLLAQAGGDPAARIAAQREAMATFAFMDGVWRGPATTTLPSGDKHAVTQTERIGPFHLVRVGESDWPGAGAIKPK